MLDIGMTELLVIGIVALIVVGPKDLPQMFRTLGRFTGKMRGMAREFQRAMEDAADESGMRDIQKDMKNLSNPKKYGLDKLNDAADRFEKWEPGKSPSSRAQAEARHAPRPEAPAKTTGNAADTPAQSREEEPET